MAIECLEGEDISFYSDIWAFGVTIWEIFTIGNGQMRDKNQQKKSRFFIN